MQAPAHTNVKSPASGQILYAGPFRVFGGLVILKSDSGPHILLGGLESLSVQADARVVKGQVVGQLAKSGKLYWEMRRGRQVLNPLTAPLN
jgi:septal ring factor EnvC (AmiA/AmiB activator)